MTVTTTKWTLLSKTSEWFAQQDVRCLASHLQQSLLVIKTWRWPEEHTLCRRLLPCRFLINSIKVPGRSRHEPLISCYCLSTVEGDWSLYWRHYWGDSDNPVMSLLEANTMELYRDDWTLQCLRMLIHLRNATFWIKKSKPLVFLTLTHERLYKGDKFIWSHRLTCNSDTQCEG